MTDHELLRRIQQGDEEALIVLHRRYVNLVYSMAYRVLGEGPLAEEATQDVFVKLWQRAGQFDPSKGSFTSWLLTVARRTAIDRGRARARRDPPSGLVALGEEEWLAIADGHVSRDQGDDVRQALAQLPPEQREVLVLAYFGGMSHSEIAKALDIPLGTVKTRTRLGMEKLRAVFAPLDEETHEI